MPLRKCPSETRSKQCSPRRESYCLERRRSSGSAAITTLLESSDPATGAKVVHICSLLTVIAAIIFLDDASPPFTAWRSTARPLSASTKPRETRLGGTIRPALSLSGEVFVVFLKVTSSDFISHFRSWAVLGGPGRDLVLAADPAPGSATPSGIAEVVVAAWVQPVERPFLEISYLAYVTQL